MTENPVNVVLGVLLIAIACAVGIVRLQPCLMRQLADWLNARADAECWFAGQHALYKKHRAEREGEK